MQEMQVWSLGREDPLEEEMATHSSILETELPGRLQSIGSQRVRHDWATKHSTTLDGILGTVDDCSWELWILLYISQRVWYLSFGSTAKKKVSCFLGNILYLEFSSLTLCWAACSLTHTFMVQGSARNWGSFYTKLGDLLSDSLLLEIPPSLFNVCSCSQHFLLVL